MLFGESPKTHLRCKSLVLSNLLSANFIVPVDVIQVQEWWLGIDLLPYTFGARPLALNLWDWEAENISPENGSSEEKCGKTFCLGSMGRCWNQVIWSWNLQSELRGTWLPTQNTRFNHLINLMSMLKHSGFCELQQSSSERILLSDCKFLANHLFVLSSKMSAQQTDQTA